MLLTEVWEALEYTNLEPPTHLIMRPVAQFFGFKFNKSDESEESSEPVKRNPSSSELSPFMAVAGRTQPAPSHMKNSLTLKKMLEEMRGNKDGG